MYYSQRFEDRATGEEEMGRKTYTCPLNPSSWFELGNQFFPIVPYPHGSVPGQFYVTLCSRYLKE